MTDAEQREAAYDKLETFAQPNVEPTLTGAELDAILDDCARAVRWTTVTVLSVGTLVLPTSDDDHFYIVTAGGTTAASEPTWPETGTVTSGTVEFEEAGEFSFSSLYDVRAALRKAWELKAAKASELISSQDSGSEQMIFDHCQFMAAKYVTPMVV